MKLITFITAILISALAYAQLLSPAELDSARKYISIQAALKASDTLQVYKIDFKGQKLKTLPTEISRFTNVQYLDLSKNNLKKFPEEICRFKYLQVLNLSRNKIDSLPPCLCELEHLRVLNLNNTEIYSLPENIDGLKSLTHLDLWGSHVGEFPDNIHYLKEHLKVIDLRVIAISEKEQARLRAILPNTFIYFSKGCNCGY